MLNINSHLFHLFIIVVDSSLLALQWLHHMKLELNCFVQCSINTNSDVHKVIHNPNLQ